MIIVDVQTHVVRRQRDDQLWNPKMVWDEKVVLLVSVTLESGETGWGEAWVDGITYTVVEELITKTFRPLLIGQNVKYFTRIWETLFEKSVYSSKQGLVYAATGAVDMAVLDAYAKALRLPLCELLGRHADSIPCYASGGLYGRDKTIDDLAAEMAGYVERGFRAVKIKAGGAPLKVDITRVAAVREAVGPDVRLMVDSLYNHSVQEAIAFSNAIAAYDVYFLEAPIAPTDIRGLAKVNARGATPVAGNEFAHGRYDYLRLMQENAVDYVHLDPILCGGVTEGLKIAAMASAFHMDVSFHSSSSAVCFAANIHLAAAVANCDSIEFHMVHQVLFDKVPEDTFVIDDKGRLKVPEGPGLGIGELRSAS